MRTYGLVIFALLLLVAWVVLRVALAVTSGMLHLLWIAAIIMFILWIIGKARGAASGRHV
jgi:hypothetical protein